MVTKVTVVLTEQCSIHLLLQFLPPAWHMMQDLMSHSAFVKSILTLSQNSNW